MSEDNLSARSTSTIDNYNELIEDDLQEEVPIPSPLRSTERFSAHESDRFGSIGFREAPKEGSIVYSDDDQDDDDKEVPSNNDHDEINNNQDDFEDLVPMSTAANSLVNVFKKESRQKKKPAWGAGAGSKKKRAAYKISPPERTRDINIFKEPISKQREELLKRIEESPYNRKIRLQTELREKMKTFSKSVFKKQRRNSVNGSNGNIKARSLTFQKAHNKGSAAKSRSLTAPAAANPTPPRKPAKTRYIRGTFRTLVADAPNLIVHPDPVQYVKDCAAQIQISKNTGDIGAQYTARINHLDALTRLHQTSLTFDHISALISFSQFWIEADNSQNAKRAAMMAKQTALALVKAESRNIFDNTFLTTSRRKRAMGTLTQENNSNDEVIDNNGDANNSSSKFTSPVFNMSEFVKNQDGSDCSSVLSTGMITAIEFESITDKVLNHISSL